MSSTFLFLSTLFLRQNLLLNLKAIFWNWSVRPGIIQASHKTAWDFKHPGSEQNCAHFCDVTFSVPNRGPSLLSQDLGCYRPSFWKDLETEFMALRIVLFQ